MPITRELLGRQLAHELRLRILRGDLAGGEALIEGALSEEFAVSRGPVRDALTELEEDGLVARSGRSLRVTAIDDSLLGELYGLRTTLEAYSIERALQRGEDLSPARAAVAAMRRASAASDAMAFHDADLDFHSAFFLAGGPVVQVHIWRIFHRLMRALLETNPHPVDDLPRAVQDHEAILEAVENGGDWRARLSSHMQEAEQRIRAQVRGEVPVLRGAIDVGRLAEDPV